MNFFRVKFIFLILHNSKLQNIARRSDCSIPALTDPIEIPKYDKLLLELFLCIKEKDVRRFRNKKFIIYKYVYIYTLPEHHLHLVFSEQ